MPRLTIEELRKKREEAKKDIYLRDGEFRSKIIVHMGTCGIAVGAREIVSAFMDELTRSQRSDILITTSGCAGLCSREPMATVEMLDSPPVRYVDLTPEKARRIFNDHLIGGGIVEEYVLGIGSEKGG